MRTSVAASLVPRMIWIERVAEHIAALEQIVFAHLFAARFEVMARGTQRRETVEPWIRLAPTVDRNDVIDHVGGLNATDLNAAFAERVLPQLVLA